MSRLRVAWDVLRGRLRAPNEDGPGIALDAASSILRAAPHAMIVFQIDNGYLLRIDSTDHNRLTGTAHLVYAPDATAVAAAIVAHQARSKLGVVEQLEMPFAGGLVGAQSQQATKMRQGYTERGR